jgi:hypothetical protein
MSKIIYDDKTLPGNPDKDKGRFKPGGSVDFKGCRQQIKDPVAISESQADSVIGMALQFEDQDVRDRFVDGRMADFIVTPYFAQRIIDIITPKAFSQLPNLPGDIVEMNPLMFNVDDYMACPNRSLLVLANKAVVSKYSISPINAMSDALTLNKPEYDALISDSDPVVRSLAFSKAPYGVITEDMLISEASNLSMNAISNPNITVKWTPDFAKRFAEAAGSKMKPDMVLKIVSMMRNPDAAKSVIDGETLTKDDVYTGTMDAAMKDIIVNYGGDALEDILKFASSYAPNVFTEVTIRNIFKFNPQPSETLMLSIVDQLKNAGMQDEIYDYAQKHNMDSLKVEIML